MGMRAVVVGSTGLVGSSLVEQLLGDARFDRVVSLVRRPSGISHPKLDEHVVDFRAPEGWAGLVAGDVLFSAMGTTIRAAKTQEAQYEVDHTFQLRVAECAAKNGVPTYVLVSSLSADPSSRIFYTRMKGELERDVRALGFRRVHIARPSFLAGTRSTSRPGESLGGAAASVLRWIPGLRKFRPIEASTVARALIAAALDPSDGCKIHESDELFELATRT